MESKRVVQILTEGDIQSHVRMIRMAIRAASAMAWAMLLALLMMPMDDRLQSLTRSVILRLRFMTDWGMLYRLPMHLVISVHLSMTPLVIGWIVPMQMVIQYNTF